MTKSCKEDGEPLSNCTVRGVHTVLRQAIEQAKNEVVLPIFYLELTTGLRRGEWMDLLWEDVDVEAKAISVSKFVCD